MMATPFSYIEGHNAVISAVEKCALWQSALNLLNSMYQVQPTVISCLAELKARVSLGHADTGSSTIEH